jgi:hypothetical protein
MSNRKSPDKASGSGAGLKNGWQGRAWKRTGSRPAALLSSWPAAFDSQEFGPLSARSCATLATIAIDNARGEGVGELYCVNRKTCAEPMLGAALAKLSVY